MQLLATTRFFFHFMRNFLIYNKIKMEPPDCQVVPFSCLVIRLGSLM